MGGRQRPSGEGGGAFLVLSWLVAVDTGKCYLSLSDHLLCYTGKLLKGKDALLSWDHASGLLQVQEIKPSPPQTGQS